MILSEIKTQTIISDVIKRAERLTQETGRKSLTQHPLLRQDPASLWSPAAVLPYADTRLPHSLADCSSTELDQLHQTLSGRLGVLGHKHGRLALEQVLLVLPGRQVPL